MTGVRRIIATGAVAAVILAVSGYIVLPEAVAVTDVLLSHRNDPGAVAEYRLDRTSAREYASHIDGALAGGDQELAISIQSLARQRGVALPAEVAARIDAAAAENAGSVAGDIWDGLTTGEATGWAGFAAAVTSDFVVIGDIRDLGEQALAYPDYDPLIVALAATGVALSGATAASIAATVFTGGGAAPSIAVVAPSKVGVSILKSAKKLDKLDPRLVDELASTARRSVDTEALGSLPEHARKLDWDGFMVTSKKVVRADAVDQLTDSASALGSIAKKQGYRATVQSLQVAQSTQEVRRLSKLSEKFGPGFRGLLALVPKAAVSLFALGTVLISMIAWTASGMLWLLAAAYFVYRACRRVVPILSRRKRSHPQGVSG